MYLVLKFAHVFFVSTSMILFQYRFYKKTSNQAITNPLKVIPHINDTLLLLTGISLAIIAGFNPLQQPWLMAKIMALFVYIGFGMVAFKATAYKSWFSYILATLTFGFIVFTAINKAPFLIGT